MSGMHGLLFRAQELAAPSTAAVQMHATAQMQVDDATKKKTSTHFNASLHTAALMQSTNGLQHRSVSMNTTDTSGAEATVALKALNTNKPTATVTTPTSAITTSLQTLNLNGTSTAAAGPQQSSQSQSSQPKSGMDTSAGVGSAAQHIEDQNKKMAATNTSGTVTSNSVQFDKFWNEVFNTPNFNPLKNHVSTIHHVKAPDYIKMSLISFLPPNVSPGLKPIKGLVQYDKVIGYELEFMVQNQNSSTQILRVHKNGGGFFFLETPELKEVKILTYQNQEGNLCFYTYVEGRRCNWITYILNDKFVYEMADITYPSRATQSNIHNK